MNKKRNVFLFGAGAAIDWKGPKTDDLTNLIKESGFKTKDQESVYITQRIFETLKTPDITEKEINFETIINVIEELIVYYGKIDKDRKIPSLISPFFQESEILKSFFNYEVKHLTDIYTLTIPGWRKSKQVYPYAGIEPKQFFFQLLLNELIDEIIVRVEEYSFHYTDDSEIINNEKKNINNEFKEFISGFCNKEEIVRLYTLNYDRVFKTILGDDVFEGFICNDIILEKDNNPPDIKRILTDFDSTCCYNLHGSAYWWAEINDTTKLYQMNLRNGGELQSNRDSVLYSQIEKGKNVILSNIITGYQKTQRSSLRPFKQMQNAFDKDCIMANNLFIIGYSFGDEHINESIKSAILYNENIHITIVDPNFKDICFKYFSEFSNVLRNNSRLEKVNNVKFEFDRITTVYPIKFGEFLNKFSPSFD